MTRFSANLGFLWNDRPLAYAIHAAKAAGFDAVECHWPYDQDINAVKAALLATGLSMLGLNTVRGNVAAGGKRPSGRGVTSWQSEPTTCGASRSGSM